MKKLARQWTIIDGKLPDQVVAFIRNQKGKMLLILKEKKEKRSLKQNAYYWAYLQIISQETGNEVDDLHEYFKRIHLPAKEITVLRRTIKIPSSTTGLSKDNSVSISNGLRSKPASWHRIPTIYIYNLIK